MCLYTNIRGGAWGETSAQSCDLNPLEVVPTRTGAGLWAGHRLAEEAAQDRVSLPRLREGTVEQKGTEEAMNVVDLGRVGACVLKHAVTGEVRFGSRRAENASPNTWPRALATHMGWSGGPEGSYEFAYWAWVQLMVHRGTIRRTSQLRILEQHAAGHVRLPGIGGW